MYILRYIYIYICIWHAKVRLKRAFIHISIFQCVEVLLLEVDFVILREFKMMLQKQLGTFCS